jgi:hypothetical protein
MERPTVVLRTLATAALVALVGCDGPASDPVAPDVSPVQDASLAPAGVPALALPSDVSAWLAELRSETAPFQRFDVGVEAGWDVPLTGCFEMSGVGGMGYHYANGALLDGDVSELTPETLLYEPQKNGRMRLVAVEYIVPFSFVPSDAPAPTVAGIPLRQNYGAGLWALHAWIWKHNPTGVFSDWNPDVNCDFAE